MAVDAKKSSARARGGCSTAGHRAALGRGAGVSAPRRPTPRAPDLFPNKKGGTPPASGGRRTLRHLNVQPVQRTLDVADRVDGDAGVERGRLAARRRTIACSSKPFSFGFAPASLGAICPSALATGRSSKRPILAGPDQYRPPVLGLSLLWRPCPEKKPRRSRSTQTGQNSAIGLAANS